MTRTNAGTAAGLAVLATAFAGGCVEAPLLGYPGSLVRVDDQGVRESMHVLAGHLNRIDDLLADGGIDSAADPRLAAIDAELAGIRAMAGALGTSAGLETVFAARPSADHLVIDAHVDDFLAAVDRARTLAAADPPRLYATGTLVGACGACHRER